MNLSLFIQTLVLTVAGLLILYQSLLHLLALRSRRIRQLNTPAKQRFAVVIPAHNEEKMISQTVHSLQGVLYPKQLYDLIVIADNCSDHTAAICRNLGVIVMERSNPKLRGKGYALRWGFDRILTSPKNYDAIVVIDSDSLVSGNFLQVMNHYIEQGSEVIQSSDLVLPVKGNWGVETTRLGYLLYNYVRPMGQKKMGIGTGLRGNGMCFLADILRTVPWEAWSRTEDLEYGLILQLQGIEVDFAPEATVWADMPRKMKHAASQRARWESGRAEISRRYALTFLRESIRKRSASHFDTFLDLIFPPLVPFMAAILFMTILYIMSWQIGWSSIHFPIAWTTLFLIGILNLFTGLAAGKADKDLYLATIRIPIYALWKIKLYAGLLLRGSDRQWIRTSRDTT